jgi:hypothetical protein
LVHALFRGSSSEPCSLPQKFVEATADSEIIAWFRVERLSLQPPTEVH